MCGCRLPYITGIQVFLKNVFGPSSSKTSPYKQQSTLLLLSVITPAITELQNHSGNA